MARTYKRLGDLLLSLDLISQEDLTRALEIQKATKKRLGQVLMEYDFISEGELIEALRLQLGVEFIDLSKVNISSDMVNVVPKKRSKTTWCGSGSCHTRRSMAGHE